MSSRMAVARPAVLKLFFGNDAARNAITLALRPVERMSATERDGWQGDLPASVHDRGRSVDGPYGAESSPL